MAEKSKVNDWACAYQLEIFKQRVIDPLKERCDNGEKILGDTGRKWKSKEQKEKAKKAHSLIESELSLYRALHGAVTDLIHQHEDMVDHLATLYALWRNNISFNGEQMPELMQQQTKDLQYIFTELYKILDPLKLPIKPPIVKKNG